MISSFTRRIIPRENYLYKGSIILILFTICSYLVWMSLGNQEASGVTHCDRLEDDTKRRVCLADTLRRLAYTRGADYALSVLHGIDDIDSAGGCHLLAHAIGYGVVDKDDTDWKAAAYSIAPSDNCSFGVVHGMMERVYAMESTVGNIFDICNTSEAWCLHGAGHIVLIESNADIGLALDVCSRAPAHAQFLCYEGAFMEYHTAFSLVAHDLVDESWLDTRTRVDDLINMCNSYVDEKAVACWEELPHVLLANVDNRLDEVFDLCGLAEQPDAADMCRLHAFGILQQEPDSDLDALHAMCKQHDSSEEFMDTCINAAGISYLYMYPDRIDEALMYCRDTAGDVRSCIHMVKSMAMREPEYLAQFDMACQALVPNQLSTCQSDVAPSRFLWEAAGNDI